MSQLVHTPNMLVTSHPFIKPRPVQKENYYQESLSQQHPCLSYIGLLPWCQKIVLPSFLVGMECACSGGGGGGGGMGGNKSLCPMPMSGPDL